MRIGLFTDTYPPFINGVSTSVEMLKNALEKKNHEVYLVTVNDSSIKYDYDEENRILKIPSIPIGLYDYRLSRIYSLKMINLIKSWNLDVIHSHTELGIGICARLVAKQFNIPLIHTYHTMYKDYTHYVTHGHFDKSSKKIVEYLTKFYCDTTATELIVPTNKTYRLFKENYKFEKNIHIIPTGIEVDRFFKENVNKKEVDRLRKNLNLSKRDTVIIFVGRLAQEKNIEFLLNAEKRIINNHSNIKLLIVGDGPDKEKLEMFSRKLGIEKNVIFTGKVAWDDMPLYYQLANFFSTASKTETQGLTVIEAMAAGITPVCIHDEAFLTSITDNLNGFIFDNMDEYVEIILKLEKNKQERAKISGQARIQAEHFSSAQFADNVLVVYNKAIENRKKYKFGIFSKITKKLKGEE